MNRLYVPSLGPTDWQRRVLTKRSRPSQARYAAFQLAIEWEAARNTDRGLPSYIGKALDAVPELTGAKLVFGIPGHYVEWVVIPNEPENDLQNDLWAMLQVKGKCISMTVGAETDEKRELSIGKWEKKNRRQPGLLLYLTAVLGIEGRNVNHLKYQLLHQAASAILEAERLSAKFAVSFVQCFEPDPRSSWDAYRAFAHVLGIPNSTPKVTLANVETSVPLYIGWIRSPSATLESWAAAV
jgi:hypothetical protein